MSDDVANKIERFNSIIQEKQVDKSTYERQKKELEKEMEEIIKKCKDEFDLTPEKIGDEIEILDNYMSKLISELEEKLDE